MPAIMNCLEEDNRTTIGGSTFSFGPKQIKYFQNPDVADAIAKIKAYEGFVRLPDELEYLAHLRKGEKVEEVVQPDHLEILTSKRKEGIDAHVAFLRERVKNAQVSLKRDLTRAGFTHDVKHEYSDGDLKNMEKLAKYQRTKDDEAQKRFDRAKELEKALAETTRA